MFRACHAHHQEKQIVSIQLLVIVIPCWWQCRVPVGSKLPQTGHTTLSSTPYRQFENQAQNTTGSNHLYNTLELLMMAIMVPETCWASNKICNKNHLLHLVGILFPYSNDDARSKPHQIHCKRICLFSLVVCINTPSIYIPPIDIFSSRKRFGLVHKGQWGLKGSTILDGERGASRVILNMHNMGLLSLASLYRRLSRLL